jgi:hypothetical protein
MLAFLWYNNNDAEKYECFFKYECIKLTFLKKDYFMWKDHFRPISSFIPQLKFGKNYFKTMKLIENKLNFKYTLYLQRIF